MRSDLASRVAVGALFVLLLPAVVGFVLLDRTSLAFLVVVAVVAWHLTLLGYASAVTAVCGAAVLCRSIVIAADPLGRGYQLFVLCVVLVVALAVAGFVVGRRPVVRSTESVVFVVLLLGLVGFMVLHSTYFGGERSRSMAIGWCVAVALPSIALACSVVRARLALAAIAVLGIGASVAILVPGLGVLFGVGAGWWDVAPIWVARAIALGALAALATLPSLVARAVTLVVATAALLAVNQLGPLLGLGVGCAVLWLVGRSSDRDGRVGRLLLAIVAVVVAALTVGGSVGASLLGDYTSQARLILYDVAWEQFWVSPWKGTGLGSFVVDLPRERLVYPHNPFLEMFAATGVLGGLLYVGVVVAGLWAIRGRREWWPVVACALVFTQFSGGLESNYELFVVIGLAIAATTSRRPDDRDESELLVPEDAHV